MQFRLFLAYGLCVSSLFAQSSTGTATMVGAVTDSTGSIIPGAKVTVTNKGAGFVFSSVSTSEGTWYIPNLNPGDYQLKIEAAGRNRFWETLERNLKDILRETDKLLPEGSSEGVLLRRGGKNASRLSSASPP